MDYQKLEMIEKLIKNYTGPILISNSTLESYPNSAKIDANCDDSDLMCTYQQETGEKILPKWHQELVEKSTNRYCMLLVQNINEVTPEKQLRFKEILKYGSINGEKVPKNCIIIVTHSDLKQKPIIETIACLLAKID